jgi:uncharacterized protein with HEPN domain
MSRDERLYLEDIVNSCDKIFRFTQGFTLDDLLRDEKTYDAVIRNLEIIGEAAKHVSDPIRGKIPEVEWRKAAGLRDMLSHVYFGIDNNILWNVIQSKIPHLRDVIRNFLNNQ